MPSQRGHFKKVITDFSGGLSNTNSKLLIADNELQTATNVWVNESGGVEKRTGYALTTNNPTLVGTAKRLFKCRFTATTRDYIFFTDGLHIQYAQAAGDVPAFIVYSGSGASPTATFTNGSAVVALAAGTSEWTTQLAVSDRIKLNSDGTYYTILTVDSNTQVTLTANYTGTTGTGAYSVRQQLNANNQSSPLDSVMLNNLFYVGPCLNPSSGTSGLLQISSSLKSKRIASSTTLDLMVLHKNYIFGSYRKGSSNTSRLYWSGSLDGTSWPSSNFVDVAPDDGGQIQGLIVFNDVLYIFKDTSIWYLVGEVFDPSNPTYALRQVPNPQGIGTLQSGSIKIFENRILFVGRDGIYAMDSSFSIKNITKDKIDRTIFTWNSMGTSPLTTSQNIPWYASSVWQNKYIVSDGGIATSVSNLAGALVLDRKGAWTLQTSKYGFDDSVILFDSNLSTLGSLRWKIYNNAVSTSQDQYEAWYDDTNVAISSKADTKAFVLGEFSGPFRVKDVYFAFEDGSTQAAKVDVYLNGSSLGLTTLTFGSVGTTNGTSGNILVYRYVVERQASTMYLHIEDATVNKGFRFLGAIIVYDQPGMSSPGVVT